MTYWYFVAHHNGYNREAEHITAKTVQDMLNEWILNLNEVEFTIEVCCCRACSGEENE